MTSFKIEINSSDTTNLETNLRFGVQIQHETETGSKCEQYFIISSCPSSLHGHKICRYNLTNSNVFLCCRARTHIVHTHTHCTYTHTPPSCLMRLLPTDAGATIYIFSFDSSHFNSVQFYKLCLSTDST